MNTIKTEAWVLKMNPDNKTSDFIKKEITFDNILDDEVLVRPLYGCMEGNMVHAFNMDPVNIFLERKEAEIVLGNSGVVIVEDIGKNVNNVQIDDICLYFCNGESDDFGFPRKITAYDKSKSLGVCAKKIKLHQNELIKIPENSPFALQQWAAFSLKYITAWSNWKVAYACWKSQMHDVPCDRTYVFGWGGGVTFAEVTLAQLFGCRGYLMTSKQERIELAEQYGIVGVNRTEYGKRENENMFVEYVNTHTNGQGVSIFIDNIGYSVYKLTLKSLGRQGIITTSGWKTGGMLPILRPNECQNRHIHVFTHYAKYQEGVEAVNYAVEKNWIPPRQEQEYCWEDFPSLLNSYANGEIVSYFPIYKINHS